MNAECPVCEAKVHVAGEPFAGELVACQACGTELEVTSLRPLVLTGTSTTEAVGDAH